MDELGNGIITLANGILGAIDMIAAPVPIAIALLAACCAWFALVEIEELDRLGTKPVTRRH